MAGPMSGADAEELDRVARDLVQLADRFGATRGSTERSLQGAPWHGPGADRFRQRWSAEYARWLMSAEHFLREASRELHDNARQQRDASGVTHHGHHGDPGHGPGFLDRLIAILHLEKGILDRGKDGLDLVIGVAKHEIVHVRSYVRSDGTVVREYVRWKPGKADTMRQVIGDARDVEGIERNVDRFGKGLAVLDGGIHGLEQWNRDDGRPLDDRITRTSAVAVTETGIALGAAATGSYIGGAIGTAIPIPVVGTVVGIGVGFAVGYGVGWASEKLHVDEHVADAASWVEHGAKHYGGEVIHAGSDVVHHGGHLIHGGANLAGKGLKKLGGLF